MKILFLGTGTSTGVPQIGCSCETCTSDNPHDNRLRASVIIQTSDKKLLVDCGPDLRTQLLAEKSPALDALLITHSHYDHVGGLIDLRSYCFPDSFPIYCQADVIKDLHTSFPYCFVENRYPGVPAFDIREIKAYKTFKFGDTEIEPLRIMHYKLPILGYRIGDLAYITDCKTMPEETLERLRGLKVLVLNALRIEPHMSHLSLSEAMEIINEVKPERTYLTHMSHNIGPEGSLELPPGVSLAYDGLIVDIK